MLEKNKIYCMDCLEGIKKLNPESVDLILTDPPYGLNKEGIKNDSDLSLFYSILVDCYRVLKKDSFFITFFSTKFLPELFKNNPFTYYWQTILYCPNGSVRSSMGYTKFMSVVMHEKQNSGCKSRVYTFKVLANKSFVFRHARKSLRFSAHWKTLFSLCPENPTRAQRASKLWTERSGVQSGRIFMIFKKGNPKIKKFNKDIFVDTPGRKVEPEEGYINHPTPKPTKFIKELLEMFSKDGDLVLDPFIGSGSTSVACQDINRNFIGFEINKEYCELANKRLKVKKKKIIEF